MSFTFLDEEAFTEDGTEGVGVGIDEASAPNALQRFYSGLGEVINKQTPQVIKALKETPRTTASSAATAGSVALGLPGDILNALNDFVAAPISSALTGKPAADFEKTPIGKVFPTSRAIEEDIHRILPFTKPKNDYEKAANEMIGTATTFMLPGGQSKTGRFAKVHPATRAFFKSIGSEVLGKAVKDLTGDEEKGELAKAGSIFSMSLLDYPGVSKFIGTVYNKAKDALRSLGNPTVNSTRFANNLNALKKTLSKGTLAPSEAAVVNEIDKALKHIDGNKIPVENLWGISRSLSENQQLAAQAAPSAKDRLRARKFFDTLKHHVNLELADFGKANPSFGIPFEEAQVGFGTLAKSKFLTNWIRNHLKYSPLTTGLLHLFGGGIGSAAVAGGAAAKSALLPLGGYQISKLLYRVKKSPLLRKYYLDALKTAAKGSAQSFNRSLEKLDKAMQKKEKEETSYTFID